VIDERAHVTDSEFARVPFVVEQNESGDPIDVRLFGLFRKPVRSRGGADLIEQFRLR
jgi:hypothetical protein